MFLGKRSLLWVKGVLVVSLIIVDIFQFSATILRVVPIIADLGCSDGSVMIFVWRKCSWWCEIIIVISSSLRSIPLVSDLSSTDGCVVLMMWGKGVHCRVVFVIIPSSLRSVPFILSILLKLNLGCFFWCILLWVNGVVVNSLVVEDSMSIGSTKFRIIPFIGFLSEGLFESTLIVALVVVDILEL